MNVLLIHLTSNLARNDKKVSNDDKRSLSDVLNLDVLNVYLVSFTRPQFHRLRELRECLPTCNLQ